MNSRTVKQPMHIAAECQSHGAAVSEGITSETARGSGRSADIVIRRDIDGRTDVLHPDGTVITYLNGAWCPLPPEFPGHLLMNGQIFLEIGTARGSTNSHCTAAGVGKIKCERV